MSFLVGSIVGGVAASVAILIPISVAARSLLPVSWRPGLAALALFCVILGEVGILQLPRVQRQARQSLGTLPPTLGTFVFGVELGSGVRTYTSSLTLYAGLVIGFLGLSWPEVLAFGIGFGLIRGVVPMDRELAASPDRWDKRVDHGYWILRLARVMAIGTAAGLLTANVVL